MSTDVLIKGFAAAILGLGFAWSVFSRCDSEIGSENMESEKQRYLPLVPNVVLPGFIFGVVVLSFVLYGAVRTAQMALSMCFGIFLHISLYYVILMCLLPFLRRHISARACAVLWLIPNYLYFTAMDYMEVPRPLIVIHAPGNWIWILFGVWLAGFAAVLLWNIVSHVRFRRQVLNGSHPVTDRAVLELWRKEIDAARIKKKSFQLVVSPGASSPLTVGLFRRRMKVVLPERAYSQDELRLIFRHEIVHIGREDNWSKFFLMFCTAMCWFNPLMWAAMRRSADDMELSCDETVLLQADEEKRRQYAGLLLSAAGDERGFTTCLSAAASSMRYRLKSIVNPRKRHSGAIVVGLTFFVLCMTCGYVALAYGDNTGEDVLFQHQDHSRFRLSGISMKDDAFHSNYVCMDEAAFNDYLAGLEMDHLTGNYSFSQFDKKFNYIYDTPRGTLAVTLADDVIHLVPLFDGEEQSSYYLPEGIDWDYLDTIVTAYPAMNVRLKTAGDNYGMDCFAAPEKLTVIENGEETLLYDPTTHAEEPCGVFGSAPYPYEAVFSFSYELAEPFTVEIENWERTSRCTITRDELTDPFVVPLPAYPAHYMVYASFTGTNGELYKAEFRFEIGAMESG